MDVYLHGYGRKIMIEPIPFSLGLEAEVISTI
ncbi:hypothetical protein HNQ85_002014 [Anoxybacillus calidus]|uniref:Uncharacterized protein n=1 Tax=[Anoxybacillus] calidus TaxID=575178 RepID=A0A7V9Z0A3_9BACL|nr:hypothetical protein [Anoxybacillus calidus]